jgi:ribose 5-phosphate isomerase B
MRIVAASDHAGLALKAQLVEALRARGHEITDLGTHDGKSVDYPDYAALLGQKVAGGEAAWGLLVCGTGVGMSIAANKVPGVRAAVVSEPFSARMARQHNDANVLCLGERVVGGGLALEILHAWLESTFEGGRHQRRVDKIGALEPNRV